MHPEFDCGGLSIRPAPPDRRRNWPIRSQPKSRSAGPQRSGRPGVNCGSGFAPLSTAGGSRSWWSGAAPASAATTCDWRPRAAPRRGRWSRWPSGPRRWPKGTAEEAP